MLIDMEENSISMNDEFNKTNMFKKTKKIKEISSWEELDSDMSILRGIYSYGFEKPSPIQKKSILSMVEGQDIIAQAQSGTGKTGAFTVGTLCSIDTEKQETQALILSPTRELAKQTYNVITSIGSYVKSLNIKLLVGGTKSEEDIKSLKDTTPQVIVGCPGRVYDMLRRNNIDHQNIKMIVIDEADEMLSRGFNEQVYNIFQYLVSDVQVCLFSATIPNDLIALTSKFMRDPVEILVKSEMLTLEGIKQYKVNVDDDACKYETLKDLYNSISMSQCIIYCNSVKRVQDLYDAMIEDKFPVACIHSNMEKEDRETAYSDFKAGKYRVLISSNVTARGIDIQQVNIVINFDICSSIHTYLHRIGRSGRWGRKGVAINFVTRRDDKLIRDIEQHYNTSIEELPTSFVITD
jgi:superfamily II DNA/RNA helicase